MTYPIQEFRYGQNYRTAAAGDQWVRLSWRSAMGLDAATWRKRGDLGRSHRTSLIPNRLNLRTVGAGCVVRGAKGQHRLALLSSGPTMVPASSNSSARMAAWIAASSPRCLISEKPVEEAPALRVIHGVLGPNRLGAGRASVISLLLPVSRSGAPSLILVAAASNSCCRSR